MTHSVIISDLHLSEAVPDNGRWMKFRQRTFFPDAEFDGMMKHLLSQAGTDPIELILNGDIFDMDAPPVIDGKLRLQSAVSTEAEAVSVMERILDDHSVFIASLGKLLQQHVTIVFISGNHDVQMTFPKIQETLLRRIVGAARVEETSERNEDLTRRILFRSWFYRTTTRLHVEHGSQYDPICAYHDPLDVRCADGSGIQPTMGSLTSRCIISKLGYFNPHVESSFMLTLPEYLLHWARYYLFSRRAAITAWAVGSVHTLMTIWRMRDRQDPSKEECVLEKTATACTETVDRIRTHAALFAAPYEDTLHSILREFWLDRAIFVVLGAAAILTSEHFGTIWMAVTACAVTGIFILYEWMMPKQTLRDAYRHVDSCEEKICGIYGVSGVIFGHTHEPFARWSDGVLIANSGSWSPSFHDVDCTVPLVSGKPVIWIRATNDGAIRGGLYRWNDGLLTRWNLTAPRSEHAIQNSAHIFETSHQNV